MRFSIFASSSLMAVAFAGSAAASDPVAHGAGEPPSAAATAAPAIADQLLAEIDSSLALASEGGYGRLKRGDHARLQKARDRISQLLEGYADPAQLPADARVELYNQQQLIIGILGKDNLDRVVCTREPSLGTRVAGTECMTVGQREARARQSRENTGFAQREHCVPGKGDDATSSCL